MPTKQKQLPESHGRLDHSVVSTQRESFQIIDYRHESNFFPPSRLNIHRDDSAVCLIIGKRQRKRDFCVESTYTHPNLSRLPFRCIGMDEISLSLVNDWIDDRNNFLQSKLCR